MWCSHVRNHWFVPLYCNTKEKTDSACCLIFFLFGCGCECREKRAHPSSGVLPACARARVRSQPVQRGGITLCRIDGKLDCVRITISAPAQHPSLLQPHSSLPSSPVFIMTFSLSIWLLPGPLILVLWVRGSSNLRCIDITADCFFKFLLFIILWRTDSFGWRPPAETMAKTVLSSAAIPGELLLLLNQTQGWRHWHCLRFVGLFLFMRRMLVWSCQEIKLIVRFSNKT